MPELGRTAARGYGHAHRKLRAEWDPIVAAGDAYCAAEDCLDPDGTERWIMPGRPWHLGHSPDRQVTWGPEHARCNTSEGASRGNRQREPLQATAGLPTTENWWA